jgi:hypothetical protein
MVRGARPRADRRVPTSRLTAASASALPPRWNRGGGCLVPKQASRAGCTGVGARTLFALALVAEVVRGAPSRFRDPARFSLAHGGKDGHPCPVPLKVYDETIRVLKDAVKRAKLGKEEWIAAIRRLDAQARAAEGAAAVTEGEFEAGEWAPRKPSPANSLVVECQESSSDCRSKSTVMAGDPDTPIDRGEAPSAGLVSELPPSPFSDQQRALLRALEERDPNLGIIYAGGLSVLNDSKNLDRFSLSGHAMRQLMEKP